MSAAITRASLLPCAGLIVAPALWAIETQLGLVLPDPECASHVRFAAIVSLPAAALALAAGFVSWRFAGGRAKEDIHPMAAYPATLSFVGWLGALNGALFAFALLLQGAASLAIDGCLR
jgi:hypothetical protein